MTKEQQSRKHKQRRKEYKTRKSAGGRPHEVTGIGPRGRVSAGHGAGEGNAGMQAFSHSLGH